MREAGIGALGEVLLRSVLKTPLGSLPNDNSAHRQIIEKAIETYKTLQK